MTWPTPQDYNEALQSPRLSFDDADLKAGIPDVTPLGLPRPITGGFASVYSVRSNSRRWAVRCFLRDFSDHRERYAEIARHIAAVRLPYMVHFQFLEKGIRVRGQWYPLLKMEWIEGLTFHEAIDANIQNSEALRNLAERWVKMLGALKKQNIAHGDLQHGNILITGDDFKLIDYDGMFVPSLSGRESHEVGHRNYQHPARVETDFGLYLDNFSGWVIYFTLMALSIEPGLWNRYGNSQEHLLFQKDDFDAPRFSRVFRSLRHMKDDRIQKYLPLFESFLTTRVQSIASPADVIGTRLKKRQPWQASLPAWFSHQLSIFSGPEAAPVPESASVDVVPVPVPPMPERIPEPIAAPKAVMEIAEPAHPAVPVMLSSVSAASSPVVAAASSVTFAHSVLAERILLLCYAAFIAVLGSMCARGILPLRETIFVLALGLVCLMLCLSCSYVLSEEVRSKLKLHLIARWRRVRSFVIGHVIARADRWKAGVDLKESRIQQSLAEKNSEKTRFDRDRIASIRDSLAAEQRFLVRSRARWKILKIRRNQRRRGDQLAIESADVRFRFKWRKDVLQRIRERSGTQLAQTDKDLSADVKEMGRYTEIRLSKYVLRILGLL